MLAALFMAYETARDHRHGAERSQSYDALRDMYTVGVQTYGVGDAGPEGGPIEVSRHNILSSVIDTAASKLLEHRPDPQVLTSGGDAILQEQARDLTDWCAAAARECDLHRVVELAAVEAMIVGTGAFRVFERDGAPACEIAYCDSIYVDPLEARHDAVLTYYQERRMDRSVLAERFPEHAERIANADVASTSSMSEEGPAATDTDRMEGTSDMVSVVLAWRCGTGSDRHGRHVIALRDVVLHDEPYETQDAPFTFIRWRQRPRSFWGIGLCESLAGMQEQVDRHTETIDETLDAMPPAIMAPTGSIKREQVDDGIARIYYYEGQQPPTIWAPGAQAVQGHAAREAATKEAMYALAGVSSMEAGAQKPAGLNSGRAQLVHQDIKSQRLLRQHRDIEDAYRDAFTRLIRVADRILEADDAADGGEDETRNHDRMVYLSGKGEDLREIAFADVRIREALYRVQVFPVSKLPDSPAGRLEFVQEMINAGILGPDDALDLFDMPDVEGAIKSRIATKRHARRLVDHAITRGPTVEMMGTLDDLAEIMRYGTQRYAASKMDGATDDDLGDLRDLLAQAEAFQRQAAEQAQAQAQAQAPAPGGPQAPAGMPPIPGMPGAGA